jgi:hypothetical protein
MVRLELLDGLKGALRRHEAQPEFIQDLGFMRLGAHAGFGPWPPIDGKGR